MGVMHQEEVVSACTCESFDALARLTSRGRRNRSPFQVLPRHECDHKFTVPLQRSRRYAMSRLSAVNLIDPSIKLTSVMMANSWIRKKARHEASVRQSKKRLAHRAHLRFFLHCITQAEGETKDAKEVSPSISSNGVSGVMIVYGSFVLNLVMQSITRVSSFALPLTKWHMQSQTSFLPHIPP